MGLKSVVLGAILLSTSLVQASDCTNVQAVQSLQLSYPAQSILTQPVDVQFRLDGEMLIAQFEVRSDVINAKEKLGPKEYPYQGDVVELFISVSGNASSMPYYEFELSPYNNTFEVRVDDLKKPFVENINMGMVHQVLRTETGWKAEMGIPLRNLGWNGDPSLIVGNAYSILGKSPGRSFWSLSLPPQVKPNFHKPEFFKPLLICSDNKN
ncbi:carbohydrate-binding family 9-like protein [Bdellovibrio svalbardensis]|uniref:Carbohydrate-binding family 9-like protein n=1 Tax=Bdellovibrio svalbardensis TaxID=2972972 RepID=A0ABT6DJR1_9BACT|nr:carbohydrate-binding family 9-like protein [Bdellovibrio svalbardensis]MDG0817105.1 carbohydrate-binding family 9-like protein [Bdellovibrio svalbardensis]